MEQEDRKVQIGVQLRYLYAAKNAGYVDINDFLNELLSTLSKKDAQYKQMTDALQAAEAEIEKLKSKA